MALLRWTGTLSDITWYNANAIYIPGTPLWCLLEVLSQMRTCHQLVFQNSRWGEEARMFFETQPRSSRKYLLLLSLVMPRIKNRQGLPQLLVDRSGSSNVFRKHTAARLMQEAWHCWVAAAEHQWPTKGWNGDLPVAIMYSYSTLESASTLLIMKLI
jgi:hypothetical protein